LFVRLIPPESAAHGYQVSTIEFSLVEVSVLHGLKQGNEVLEEIHKEMNLETVEKLLEETQEAREYQRVSARPPLLESGIHTRVNRRLAKCWPIT